MSDSNSVSLFSSNLTSVFGLFYVKQNINSITFYHKTSECSKAQYLNLWAKDEVRDGDDLVKLLSTKLPEAIISSSFQKSVNPDLGKRLSFYIIDEVYKRNLNMNTSKDYLQPNPLSFEETKVLILALRKELNLSIASGEAEEAIKSLDELVLVDMLSTDSLSENEKIKILNKLKLDSSKYKKTIKSLLTSDLISENYKKMLERSSELDNKLDSLNSLPKSERIAQKKTLLANLKAQVGSFSFAMFGKKATAAVALSLIIGSLNVNIDDSGVEYSFDSNNIVQETLAKSSSSSSRSSSSSSSRSSSSSSSSSKSSSSSSSYGGSSSSKSYGGGGSSSSSSSRSSSNGGGGMVVVPISTGPSCNYSSRNESKSYRITNFSVNVSTQNRGASNLANVLNSNNIKNIYFENDRNYSESMSDGCDRSVHQTKKYFYDTSMLNQILDNYSYNSSAPTRYLYSSFGESFNFSTEDGSYELNNLDVVYVTLKDGSSYKLKKSSSPSITKNIVGNNTVTNSFKINSYNLKFTDSNSNKSFDFNSSNTKLLYSYVTSEDKETGNKKFMEESNSLVVDYQRTNYLNINGNIDNAKAEFDSLSSKKSPVILKLNIHEADSAAISTRNINSGDQILVEQNGTLYKIEVVSEWSPILWGWFITLLKVLGGLAGIAMVGLLGKKVMEYAGEHDIIFDIKEGAENTKKKMKDVLDKVLQKFSSGKDIQSNSNSVETPSVIPTEETLTKLDENNSSTESSSEDLQDLLGKIDKKL